MDRVDQLDAARALGQRATRSVVRSIRRELQGRLRSAIGVRREPPPRCDDPERSYFAPDSIVRQVHGDLPAMLIGGLASLFLQSLHPLAMAGVAQHSRYREDPLGRLERTASFLAVTSFGSRDEANRAIESVRQIHASVTGMASDGRPYEASDPELLTWVHAAEVASFLAGYQAYGPRSLSDEERDRYLAEVSRVALDLGAEQVPGSVDELNDYFTAMRPELCLSADARTARNFLLRGVRRWPPEVAAHGIMIAAAQGILPPWARRELRLITFPASDRLAVRPVAHGLCVAMRWVARPPDLDTPAFP
jgi:uncharacterized protein (DUF2236 family)